MNIQKNFILFLTLLLIASCGEEVLTKSTVSESVTASKIESFSIDTCASSHFDKPPVDLLFIVDNTGSTLADSFQVLKQQIANTINTISNEFDYHIYVAPLISLPNDNIMGYPLLINNPSSLTSLALANVVSPENLQFFSDASGNNQEAGFQRAQSIISANRSNGIFRNNANTVIVVISNGDDTQSIENGYNGSKKFNQAKFDSLKNNLLSFTKKYASSNIISNPMNAESLRFISLVAHSNCNGFKKGEYYQKMSQEIYDYMKYTDDNSLKDSRDLCSKNFESLFSAINSSIKATLVGHSYDHWLISKAKESEIQQDDITVIKILEDKTQQVIAQSSTNGFEYLGYKTNHNTRYLPDVGEPVSGLVIKLNGDARVNYPECIIAKTRTPTEYYGYLALSSKPDLSTLKIIIRGKEYPQSGTNGWSYIGYLETKNTKVPGPTDAAVTPALNKSGYFIQLNGEAIYTNGETIEVYYKPASL